VIRSAAAAISLGLAFGVAAGPALAGTPGPSVSLGKSKGIEYFKGTYQDVVTQTNQPVECDISGGGEVEVTGGGGSISGPAETSTLFESQPLPQEAWQVEGASTAGVQRMTGYAICGPVDLVYAINQTPITTNSSTYVLATCPDPIGGGGGATGAGLRLNMTQPALPPSTPGWSSQMVNTTGSDSLFDYYGICGTYDVKFRRAVTKIDDGESGSVIASCKGSETLLGGGFAGIKNDAVGYHIDLLATRPVDSKDDKKKVPDDGWQVKAANIAGLNNLELTAIATCRQ
jgi:hypothetical protein